MSVGWCVEDGASRRYVRDGNQRNPKAPGTLARVHPGGWEVHVALAGALVSVAAVAVATSGAPSNAAFGRGLLELLIVGTPIAAGLYALRAPLSSNFGIALLLVGF
jgi:hypothetical protein